MLHEKETLRISGLDIDVYRFKTVIIGCGVAGLNAADALHSHGQEDIAVICEGLSMGTSRNTGSDKQTYYKLSSSGGATDSVREMAETLFSGGCVHGDVALIEAALSSRCFYKLVELGVPFPHNEYGEYIGYKTDHDPRERATSAGPLTSKFMTERLEKSVKQRNIPILERYQLVSLLLDENRTKTCGVLAIDLDRTESGNFGFTVFNCTNIVYATGGPAGIYKSSVYPESQFGSLGAALEAGAIASNLSESQYGIASLKFRWNLSGTYQQVMPRYISCDKSGNDPHEFLLESFPDKSTMLRAIFLKGYQWPFDPRKLTNHGSSLIDLLVYRETEIKSRRVFLDFTENPGRDSIDYAQLEPEVRTYLEKSEACFGRPIDRLEKMNFPAIELYRSNGIDIRNEPLEIAVCAQHCNGGLRGNCWWESNLAHFFPVGECNGSFGVYRPGGSALNSTQAGSLRAAQFISRNYTESPPENGSFLNVVQEQLEKKFDWIRSRYDNLGGNGDELVKMLDILRNRMSRTGAHIRSEKDIEQSIAENREDWKRLQKLPIGSSNEIPQFFRIRDAVITQFAMLESILEHIRSGGVSRGSYLVLDSKGTIPIKGLDEYFRARFGEDKLWDRLCELKIRFETDEPETEFEWKPVRPIPETDDWFENVWTRYRNGEVFRSDEPNNI